MRKPQTPPSTKKFEAEFLGASNDVGRVLRTARDADKGSYYHWDELRRRKSPDGITHEELWGGIKLLRKLDYISLPLINKLGYSTLYCPRDQSHEFCREIDLNAGGTIETSSKALTEENQERYYISSLIEEAATSSILEGAATTRAVAAEMIRSNRKPKSKDERMILNNYFAMRQISDIQSDALTPKMVLELHRTVTRDTLDDSEQEGRLRTADEEVRVYDNDTNEVLHTPPAAKELEDRMQRMCDFANGETPDSYLHPVVRSIILHYWLAYDHPFVDGNGRTARALFYWSMLHHGYWLFKFISISRILLAAPAQYARAYLYSESDQDDVTYFVYYQFKVIRRALQTHYDYLHEKNEEIRYVQDILDESERFNYRQYALLTHALRHPGFSYSIRSHRNSHGVAYQTARKDLLDLAEHGFLEKTKRGKTYFFRSPSNLASQLKKR